MLLHGGGKSCEERESMGVSRVPVCGRVGEEEEGRRLCGREAVVGRGEFEQGAVGCRERQKRAESVWRLACEAQFVRYVSYYLASRVRSEREVVKRGAAANASARRFGMR